jgi:molybdopterin molybdotransferase
VKADRLLPVEEAKARILAGVRPLARERLALGEALGRTLAADLKARRDQPPRAVSAMDGYAVRAADVARVPATLALVGAASAGDAARRRVGPGETIRIFTGATVPDGADAIVIQENASVADGRVTVTEPVSPGRFIRRQGLDFTRGETLLQAPCRLGPRELALAASMGHGVLGVRRRPVVAILATGSELVPPGTTPRAGQLVSSNSIALAGLVELWGGVARDLGIARDDMDATRRALAGAEGADVLVTTGGVSVGEHDLVRQALIAEGYKLGFWKIAMRPGKPLMLARYGRRRALGLPGNPVSAIVCARVFLKPLMAALLGLEPDDSGLQARLAKALPANDRRQDYLRASLDRAPDGTLTATAFPVQDSSMQRTLALADGLIVRPPFDPAQEPGAPVTVLPLDF